MGPFASQPSGARINRHWARDGDGNKPLMETHRWQGLRGRRWAAAQSNRWARVRTHCWLSSLSMKRILSRLARSHSRRLVYFHMSTSGPATITGAEAAGRGGLGSAANFAVTCRHMPHILTTGPLVTPLQCHKGTIHGGSSVLRTHSFSADHNATDWYTTGKRYLYRQKRFEAQLWPTSGDSGHQERCS